MKQTPAVRKSFIGDLLGEELPLTTLAGAPLLSVETGAIDPDEPVLKFSTRLSRTNDLHLQRAAYWLPGRGAKIQAIVNAALSAYFAQHPDAQRPTPDE